MNLTVHNETREYEVSAPKTWKSVDWSRFAGPAIIVLAAAVAIVPLIIRGPSCGDDFDFHFVSWVNALNSWQHGILYPHWAASANYGAGEPRFVFYPPLSWMLGAALGAVIPWYLVPVILTFLLLAATGLATRALAREVLADGAATLAGCVALFSGYALFTAYERVAFGELTGGFWIPLLLLYILRDRRLSASLLRRTFDGSTLPLTLILAGCWLSNIPIGIMACYLLAAIAIVAATLERSWAPIVRAAVATTLGMGVTSFLLCPAIFEQRWVDVSQVTDDPGFQIESNWLFAHNANPNLAIHDVVLQRVSLIALTMMVVVMTAALQAPWRRCSLPTKRRLWICLALIPPVVFFLLFPISLPVWNLLPKLRFLQFPWRWLVVLEAPMALYFVAAIWPRESALRKQRTGTVVVCGVWFLLATFAAGVSFFQRFDQTANLESKLANIRSGNGAEGYDEYEPPGTDESLAALDLPDACLTVDPATALGVRSAAVTNNDGEQVAVWRPSQGSCQSTFTADAGSWNAQSEHLRLKASVPHAGYLILHLRNYPAWLVRVNGQTVGDLPQRDDALMAVPVAQGPVNLTVDWTTTPDVVAGRWLSVLALLFLAALWAFERRLIYHEVHAN